MLFISFAHVDGAELAQRLVRDFASRGVESWFDKQRLHGGAIWTEEIENALDQAEVVLALLTPGSYSSEICRAEQLRSLRKGKCVIPLIAQTDADVPLHLESRHYLNFSGATCYDQQFESLLKCIAERDGVSLKSEYRSTYVTAPPLPINFVPRPIELAALRDALVADGGGQHIGLTALEGMGGIGKTIMAQALCADEIVQEAFPDGIIWITIGKELAGGELIPCMREIARALKDQAFFYDTRIGSIHRYRSILRSKALLIVLDDVWHARALEPFCADSPRSRLLFTTRDASIAAAVGARAFAINLLTEKESQEVFKKWSGWKASELPPETDELIQECGRLPLALSMVAAMLRGKPVGYWNVVLNHLRKSDLERIRAQFPHYAHPNLFRAVQVSVDELDDDSCKRYFLLAVLLEDTAADVSILRTLWNVDESAAIEIAEEFVTRSLATRFGDSGIRLHDLQVDYVREKTPLRNSLPLIHDALRLSAHVISQDPVQFASQLRGRLLPYKNDPAIGGLLACITDAAPRPWLCPLHPGLTSPGMALIRTLADNWKINCIAVRHDGRLAVSGSRDNTLKVLDVDTGREIRLLAGHSGSVTCVALSADGQRAISASLDKTLRVWDVNAGREIHSLVGHSGIVTCVALSADGRCAVSASVDDTLRVWNLDTGQEVRALRGTARHVTRIALSADGHRAVSICASEDNAIRIWDVVTGEEVRSLTNLPCNVSNIATVALSADGRHAVSASGDFALRVWDLHTGREVCTLPGHTETVHRVALSADGRRAASASHDCTIKVWDLYTLREVCTLAGHSAVVWEVTLSEDGRRVVSLSDDNTVKVWDVDKGVGVLPPVGRSPFGEVVVLSADGRRAVSTARESTVTIWDVDTGRKVRSFLGCHQQSGWKAALSADGRRAVFQSAGDVIVSDLQNSPGIRWLPGGLGFVALSADGLYAVFARSTGRVLELWDMETGRMLQTLVGREVHRLAGHPEFSNEGAVALSGDGELAVAVSLGNTLKVWDLNTGNEVRTLVGHSDRVDGVALSVDGRRAVSYSMDQTVRVWDVEAGREIGVLAGHSDTVLWVVLSADGQRAVSTSFDKTLRVWDVGTGTVLATFTCDVPVRCATFAESGTVAASDVLGQLHFFFLL